MTESNNPESAMQVDERNAKEPEIREFMLLADLKELERKIKGNFNFDRSETEPFSRLNELLGVLIGRAAATLAVRMDQ